MLLAYLDDSGSEPNSQVFVIAGFLATAEKWRSFAIAWDRILKRSPYISYWKSSASFDELTKEQLSNKAQKLALVIKRHTPLAIDFRMPWNTFMQAQSEFPLAKHLKAYEMLFHGILASITHYLESRSIPEKVEFIFDCQGTLGTDAIGGYNKIRGLLPISIVERIAGLSMQDDKLAKPLQAADLLAWNLRRFHGVREKFPALDILEGLPTLHRVYELIEVRSMFRDWVRLSNSS